MTHIIKTNDTHFCCSQFISRLVFLSLCGPNFDKNLEFKNNLRTKLKKCTLQVPKKKFQNKSKNSKPVASMRFETRSFSPQNIKEMEDKRVERKWHITSPLTGKVCMDFRHFSCRKNGILRRRTDSNSLDKMYLRVFMIQIWLFSP